MIYTVAKVYIYIWMPTATLFVRANKLKTVLDEESD